MFFTYKENDPKKCYFSLFMNVSLLVVSVLNYCVNYYIIFFFMAFTYTLCSSFGSLALMRIPDSYTEMG